MLFVFLAALKQAKALQLPPGLTGVRLPAPPSSFSSWPLGDEDPTGWRSRGRDKEREREREKEVGGAADNTQLVYGLFLQAVTFSPAHLNST